MYRVISHGEAERKERRAFLLNSFHILSPMWKDNHGNDPPEGHVISHSCFWKSLFSDPCFGNQIQVSSHHNSTMGECVWSRISATINKPRHSYEKIMEMELFQPCVFQACPGSLLNNFIVLFIEQLNPYLGGGGSSERQMYLSQANPI